MTEEQELKSLTGEEYCYLTTLGRVSGRPHEIEIWFGLRNNTVYLLSGGRDKSDWVRNLLKNPSVTVRIAKRTFAGIARLVQEPEEAAARFLVARKYHEMDDENTLDEWARTALPVAIDLKPLESQ